FAPTGRYLAFILTADGNVALVDLGEANTLEGRVTGALEDIRVSLKTHRTDHIQRSIESLRQLSKNIWAPLEKSLVGTDKVILSPDGILNLIPFAALMDGEGKPLLERYRIAYVSSGRELVGTE